MEGDSRLSMIPYIGGKYEQAPWIVAHFPTDYPKYGYCEPFGGALSVFLYKNRSFSEILNDINGDVVNLWWEIQNEPEQVAAAAGRIPYSKALYERIANDWYRGFRPLDPVTRAVWFYYLCRSAFSAKIGAKSGWARSITKDQAGVYFSSLEGIKSVSDRLRGAQLDCTSFEKCIPQNDSDNTLFYCDPPFVNSEKRYKAEFGEVEHRKLAEILNKIKGKVLVSYYDHPLLHELYPESDGWVWHRRETAEDCCGTVGEKRGIDQPKRRLHEVLMGNFKKVERLSLFAPARGD